MDHARAQDLEPAGLAADAAAGAGAREAPDVDLSRGLRERKERRAEADRGARAEHLAREELERTLEIAHGDVGVHRQAFHLVEHRGMRVVRVAAVRLAWADDANWRR